MSGRRKGSRTATGSKRGSLTPSAGQSTRPPPPPLSPSIVGASTPTTQGTSDFPVLSTSSPRAQHAELSPPVSSTTTTTRRATTTLSPPLPIDTSSSATRTTSTSSPPDSPLDSIITQTQTSSGSSSLLSPMQNVRRSARQKAEKERQIKEYTGKFGSTSAEHSSNDLTHHFGDPLEDGKDGRGYVQDSTRRALKESIEGSRQEYPSLEKSPIPGVALKLREQAATQGRGSMYLSSRTDTDQYRSGTDYAYTENRGIQSDKRKAKDTPEPRSPHPEGEGTALPGTRYERSHSEAHRFTNEPGHTVHAPTQANQAIDSVHENFAAKRAGSFIFQQHTYDATSTYTAQPTDSGSWLVQQSSYRRRISPQGSPAASSSAPTEPPKKKVKGQGSDD